MIRILHTIDTTGPGGAETVFVNLIKSLDHQKFEPIVIIRGPGWVSDELRKNGITPLFVNSKGAFNFKYLWELVRIIRKYKIDIIQSHLLGSNLYSSLAGKICGVPVVSTFHGFVDIHSKERFSTLKSMVINCGSSQLVFVSDSLKEFYIEQKGFSTRKAVTIYNGIDTSLFRPQRDYSIRGKLGVGADNILVGAVGNIRPAKGYEYLLRAAKMIVERCPTFRFVIAGEGHGKLFDDLNELRIKLGLENHLFFWGFEHDIAKFMNNIDIFVLSSVSEGFSISTIEAMACSIPVIATRSGGPEEIISHLENGILVEACSPEGIMESIIRFHENRSTLVKILDSGMDVVKNKYTLKVMTGKYADLYRKIRPDA